MKKILIVNSQSIYKNNATGITLRSIISALQGVEVMEIHRYESRDIVDEKIGIASLQIPPQSMPLNYVVRKYLGLDNYYDKEPVPSAVEEYVTLSDIKKCLTTNIKSFLETSVIIPDKSFMVKIDTFHPDVIYTMGGSIYIHKWVLFLSKRYNAPIIMHYMDNWRQTMFANEKGLLFSKYMLQKQLKEIESKMKAGLTISSGMADAYRKLYGKPFYPLMNTVEAITLAKPPSDDINIVYAGGLHLNRYKSLLEVANAITGLNKVRLFVYTSESNRNNYEHLFPSGNVKFMPAVPHEEIGTVYESANILLHIESFDENVIEYTKYSLSTKIPEYLFSERPLICYAPKSIEAFKYIQSSGAGLCVDNIEDLQKAISELLNEKRRNELGANGKPFAERYHSVDKLSETVSLVISKSL